jgi:hypothetical protein
LSQRRSLQIKTMHIPPNISFHWPPFVRRSVDNKPRVKFTHRSNHTEHTKNPVSHNLINSTSQVMIAFQPKALLKRIHRLLVINF